MNKLELVRKLTPKDEWQVALYKKYPKLFGQHGKSMKETCMCWGISVGIGWLPIIELLCESMQRYVDVHKIDQIEFVQIKEKYGTLQIYTNYHDEIIQELINTAERLSEKICEECGSVVNVTSEGGYILTLCELCRKKRGKL